MKTKMRNFRRGSFGIEGRTSKKLAAIIFIQDLEKILKSEEFSDFKNVVFFMAHSKRFENLLLQQKARWLLRTLNLN